MGSCRLNELHKSPLQQSAFSCIILWELRFFLLKKGGGVNSTRPCLVVVCSVVVLVVEVVRAGRMLFAWTALHNWKKKLILYFVSAVRNISKICFMIDSFDWLTDGNNIKYRLLMIIVYCLSPARKYFVHEKEDVKKNYCLEACILHDHTRSPCNSLRMQRSTFILMYVYIQNYWGALYDKQV